MSRLTVYRDDAPGTPLVRTEDAARIAEELRAIGEVPVDVRDARYREALVRDAELLASRELGDEAVERRPQGLFLPLSVSL